MKRIRALVPFLALLVAACLVTAVCTVRFCSRNLYGTLSALCAALVREQPDLTAPLLRTLRQLPALPADDLLLRLGYRPEDLPLPAPGLLLPLLLLAASLLLLLWRDRQLLSTRLDGLTARLESFSLGRVPPPPSLRDGPFARLEEEMGRAYAALARTRDDALAQRRNFADSLASIAHQLRTPTAALLLLQQTGGSRAQTEHQLHRLLHLEESLLLLARMDAGVLPLEPRETDLYTLLTIAEDTLEPLFRERQVQLDLPEDAPPFLTADPEWTLEAILNVLRNALDHSPPGGHIRCRWEDNPLCVRLTISDEGPGIPPQDLPHLFERFYRGQNAAPGGVGLGLPLARELLERQNGSLRVLSGETPARGACFELTFYRH